MKCFYHSDLDGRCSAACIAQLYNTNCSRSDFYEIDYGDPFPFDVIRENERVLVLDWSLNQIENGWEQLIAITNQIVWIDHHVSAINGCMYKFKGIQDTKSAACALTWKFIFPSLPFPHAFDLIADYDTWKFYYGEDSTALNKGLSIYDTHPMSNVWDRLKSEKFLDKVLGEGYIILRSFNSDSAFKANKLGFVTEFEGIKALAVNAPYAGSKVFSSVSSDAELYIVYKHDGERFTVSLYTSNKDINCSELASKYGGGGHVGSAGFQCETLPFKKLGGIN